MGIPLEHLPERVRAIARTAQEASGYPKVGNGVAGPARGAYPGGGLPGASGAKRSKYGAIKTQVDGITFDSKREAAFYQDLLLQKKAGVVVDIDRQHNFPIIINDFKVCIYRADFVVRMADGRVRVIDVKGFSNRIYSLKKKLMRAVHGIAIEEV
jgi:hypothetical protein